VWGGNRVWRETSRYYIGGYSGNLDGEWNGLFSAQGAEGAERGGLMRTEVQVAVVPRRCVTVGLGAHIIMTKRNSLCALYVTASWFVMRR